MEIPNEIFYGGMAVMASAVIYLHKQQTDSNKQQVESRVKCEQSNAKMFDKIETLVGRVGYLEGLVSVLNPSAITNTNNVTTNDAPTQSMLEKTTP
jgi:hypothetical protein